MQNLYRTAAVVTIFSALEHGLGFFYRIILSRILGPEGLGIYQVSLTVFAVFLTASSSGLPVTLSRTISKHRASGSLRGEQAATSAAVFFALIVSLSFSILLFLFKTPFSKLFSDPRCADLFYILLIGLSFTSIYSVLRGNFWGRKQFFAYSLVELFEEIVRIFFGVFFLLVLDSAISDVNLAAGAVLISYLASFCFALIYYIFKGGKFKSPKGEFLPLVKSALPVTAMRTSSSLVNSFISVLFPMRLQAAGASSSRAMSAYGVVYGMVLPVLMIPSSLIGSIALVLVPELSECYYKKEREKLSALVEKALNAALLIAGILIPLFVVCGKDAGTFLFSNGESGQLISQSAYLLLPMSLSMIATSLLNSLNCERETLIFFLIGALSMLLCTFFLPKYIGNGALLVGMACNFSLSAVLSLFLLAKKTGALRSGKYALKLLLLTLPVFLLGSAVRKFLMSCLSFLPAAFFSALFTLFMEIALFQAFRLMDLKALILKFFGGKLTSLKKKKAKLISH